VGHGDATRKETKPRFPDLVEITNRPVGHGSHTTQGLVDVGLNLSPEGTYHGPIHVVKNNDSRRRDLLDLLPPGLRRNPAALRRVCGNYSCDRIADHGRVLWEDAFDFGKYEPLVSGANVEKLDGI
jgi:hypothetical protein